MYDPKIGRFLSPDPLLEMFPEQSSYQYAYNSPLIWKDPSGLKSEKEQGDKMMGMETLLLQIANFFVDVTRNMVDNSNKNCKCTDTRPCGCSNGGGSSNGGGGSTQIGTIRYAGGLFEFNGVPVLGYTPPKNDGSGPTSGGGGDYRKSYDVLSRIKSFDNVFANWSSFSENMRINSAYYQSTSSNNDLYASLKIDKEKSYRNKHNIKATTLDEFAEFYKGKTENQIITGEKSILGYKYPFNIDKRFRFVKIGNGREIDMIHFFVVGRRGHIMGMFNEIQQLINLNWDSAFYPQDFYSNHLGVKFFEQYSNEIKLAPFLISYFIKIFLNNPNNW